MANNVLARQAGDDYQAKFFWLHASRLNIPHTCVKQVAWEMNGTFGFDDVVVYYDPASKDPSGGDVIQECYQVKFHVDHKRGFSWEALREAEQWDQTHPLEQIRWTRDKNKNTNKHFVNVVKALKWWRTLQLTNLKYPKGYPIEHMIGDRCPDGISSVAEGVSKTLEGIVDAYYMDYILDRTPILCDRGVPEHDVWKRVSVEDFKSFYDSVKEYSNIAKEALEAESLKEQVNKWRQIFGDKFPPYDDDDDDASGKNSITPSGGFTPRKENSDVESGRFA